MGQLADSFGLKPYQRDSFFWKMTHDECAKRGRYTFYSKEYYIVRFGYSRTTDKAPNCLWWKHDDSLPGDGEVFQKRDATADTVPRKKVTGRKMFLDILLGRSKHPSQAIDHRPMHSESRR